MNVVDLKLAYTPKEDLGLSIAVDNLLDREYYQYYKAPRRTITFEVSYKVTIQLVGAELCIGLKGYRGVLPLLDSLGGKCRLNSYSKIPHLALEDLTEGVVNNIK